MCQKYVISHTSDRYQTVFLELLGPTLNLSTHWGRRCAMNENSPRPATGKPAPPDDYADYARPDLSVGERGKLHSRRIPLLALAAVHILHLQRSAKRYANIAKQDPSRARLNR